jgi:hypothetical protein
VTDRKSYGLATMGVRATKAFRMISNLRSVTDKQHLRSSGNYYAARPPYHLIDGIVPAHVFSP